jgi:hypothetical protein
MKKRNNLSLVFGKLAGLRSELFVKPLRQPLYLGFLQLIACVAIQTPNGAQAGALSFTEEWVGAKHSVLQLRKGPVVEFKHVTWPLEFPTYLGNRNGKMIFGVPSSLDPKDAQSDSARESSAQKQPDGPFEIFVQLLAVILGFAFSLFLADRWMSWRRGMLMELWPNSFNRPKSALTRRYG